MFSIGSSEVLVSQLSLAKFELNKLNEIIKKFRLNPHLRALDSRLHKAKLEHLLNGEQALTASFNICINSIIKQLNFTCMILLVDTDGVVLDAVGPSSASNSPIGVGTSLAIQSAGTNAVSAAMLLNRPVYIEREQHYLHLFKNWACVCLPIYGRTGLIEAYIDFSTSPDLALSVYYPLIYLMKAFLEFQIQDQDEYRAAHRVELIKSKLTPRQYEVASIWISGEHDYKSIATKLYISDKTVRTIIAEIYRRLNVHSKSEIISLFLRGNFKP